MHAYIHTCTHITHHEAGCGAWPGGHQGCRRGPQEHKARWATGFGYR